MRVDLLLLLLNKILHLYYNIYGPLLLPPSGSPGLRKKQQQMKEKR